MRITFLGSGSAFCLDNYQSNMLIEDGNLKLLFDCGSDIRFALKEQGLNALNIDGVYISHLHADHVGGLEYIAFMNYFVKTIKTGFRPALIGNHQLIRDVWKKTLCGGLQSIQMVDAKLDTFFDVKSVQTNGTFIFGQTEYKLVQTVHVVADRTLVKSFGLIFRTPGGKKIFITSDTQFSPSQLKDFIVQADMVFHDCETSPYASGVHAHYDDMKSLPDELKAKIWLYHVSDGELPDAEADGFQGIVKKGSVFDF